jgi:hypothetical protein
MPAILPRGVQMPYEPLERAKPSPQMSRLDDLRQHRAYGARLLVEPWSTGAPAIGAEHISSN